MRVMYDAFVISARGVRRDVARRLIKGSKAQLRFVVKSDRFRAGP